MRRLALAAGLLGATAAWPCSGPSCDSIVVPVPAPGSTIPSNAPAVGIQLARFSDVMFDGGIETRPASSVPLDVRGPDGGLITGLGVEPFIGNFVGTTLAEGPMTLTWGGNCASDAGFVVGPPEPLPTLSANLSLVETVWLPSSATSGLCSGAHPDQQAARLRIEPTAEMLLWLPVARWELEVDGANATTSRFGLITAAGYELAPFFPFPTFNSFRVQCGPTPDGGAGGSLQPGVHSVRVLARILGVSTPIASNTLQVEVLCTPPEPIDAGVIPTPDAGTESPDAGVESPDAGQPLDAGEVLVSDAGVPPDAGTQATPPPPMPSGCSVAALEWSALAMLLLRRRRP